jgi:hypothetical protein
VVELAIHRKLEYLELLARELLGDLLSILAKRISVVAEEDLPLLELHEMAVTD